MDTIKSYLENMFSSMPDTEEVRRAKEELYQMMEDKYLEMKAEGKTENEAIGTVIAEFGNLEELKEEIGIYVENNPYEEKECEPERKKVSLFQLKEYLSLIGKYSNYIAAGVMLCIFSPVWLLFFAGLAETYDLNENAAATLGVIILFAFIAVAVAIFIYSDKQISDYEYLKKEPFKLEQNADTYIIEERKRNKSNYSMKMIIGVTLCILSVIPLFCSLVFDNEFFSIITLCLLLVIVGIGVYFIVSSVMVEDSYKILLQEGEYNKKNKDKRLEAISSIYWCVVTAIYLGWSFWTFKWGITWIIWPVAGVLYGAVVSIYKIVSNED